MEHLRNSLGRAASLIADYREGLPGIRVGPTATRAEVRNALDPALPEKGETLESVLDEMVSAAQPGLMASAGPRYFGFVVGGSLDAALIAEIMAVGWDQVAFNEATSPAALAFEVSPGGDTLSRSSPSEIAQMRRLGPPDVSRRDGWAQLKGNSWYEPGGSLCPRIRSVVGA